jgi:hypothetical protein
VLSPRSCPDHKGSTSFTLCLPPWTRLVSRHTKYSPRLTFPKLSNTKRQTTSRGVSAYPCSQLSSTHTDCSKLTNVACGFIPSPMPRPHVISRVVRYVTCPTDQACRDHEARRYRRQMLHPSTSRYSKGSCKMVIAPRMRRTALRIGRMALIHQFL